MDTPSPVPSPEGLVLPFLFGCEDNLGFCVLESSGSTGIGSSV